MSWSTHAIIRPQHLRVFLLRTIVYYSHDTRLCSSFLTIRKMASNYTNVLTMTKVVLIKKKNYCVNYGKQFQCKYLLGIQI